MSTSPRRHLVVTSLVAALAGGATLAFAQDALSIEWRVVARQGEGAPGIPNGSKMFLIGLNVVGHDRLVFSGAWTPPGTDESHAVFAWSPEAGTEALPRLQGSTITVGDTDLHVSNFRNAISGGNRLVVDHPVTLASCPPGRVLEASFLLDESGVWVPALWPGMPVPGIGAGWLFSEGAGAGLGYADTAYTAPKINEQGDLAFFARIDRTTICNPEPSAPFAYALFGPDGAGGFTLVAVPNDPAPGAPTGAVMTPTGTLELNAAGEIAFGAKVRLGPSGPTVDAIYRWDVVHGLRPVAIATHPDPYGSEGRLSSSMHLGGGGHVASATYTGEQLFVQTAENGREVRVQRGDPAPGLAEGIQFLGVSIPETNFSDFAVNASGDVAFVGYAALGETGPSVVGVWGPDTAGALALKLLDAQAAPDLAGLRINHSEVLALSDQRAILVRAYLEGPGVDFGNSDAYYLIDASGHTQLLVRNGGDFEFAAGDTRSVRLVELLFDADLDRFAFNALDRFNGIDAIFHASVPEPRADSLALVAFAAIAAVALRESAR